MAEVKLGGLHRKLDDISSYVFFTVPISFSPIGLLYLTSVFNGRRLTSEELILDGGVLTISISLAAEALGRLVASGSKWREIKRLAAIGSIAAIIFGSFFYALRSIKMPTNPLFVHLCTGVVVVSMSIALVCRLLPEGDR
jgi:hypothetical protein